MANSFRFYDLALSRLGGLTGSTWEPGRWRWPHVTIPLAVGVLRPAGAASSARGTARGVAWSLGEDHQPAETPCLGGIACGRHCRGQGVWVRGAGTTLGDFALKGRVSQCGGMLSFPGDSIARGSTDPPSGGGYICQTNLQHLDKNKGEGAFAKQTYYSNWIKSRGGISQTYSDSLGGGWLRVAGCGDRVAGASFLPGEALLGAPGPPSPPSPPIPAVDSFSGISVC